MTSLYQSPLRVYLCLGLLAFLGIFSGAKLPVSMFPNSSKPQIAVSVPYGNFTAEEFSKNFGMNIEYRLRGISDSDLKVESIETEYSAAQVRIIVEFAWGVEQKRALKEVQTAVYSLSAQFPEEIRLGLNINSWDNSSGFLGLSIYSDKRNLDELYKLIEPTLTPRLAQIQNTQAAVLWNPTEKVISVELKPQAMAALQVLPRDVSDTILNAIGSLNGGSLTVNSTRHLIQMPKLAMSIQDLGRIPLVTKTGKSIHLQDVARIELKLSEWKTNSFKTSGAPSLILFAQPAPGGNIKEMSESIIKIVDELKPSWPKDVHVRNIVDPSEFIRDSIANVEHEVALAALLSVVILFLFIGSFRNVATAAIEIPISIVLAFILMRLCNININLISLGGLALSAGMNVDASVVVMENIFRHFELFREKSGNHHTPLTYTQRRDIIVEAVREVQLPVIASTIASIVVFLPLAFTSNLSYAILGDLAKTVVFSHGFSAIVALVLVPTIRLQLMSGTEKPPRSPIEGALNRLENLYVSTLNRFLSTRVWQWAVGGIVTVFLAGLITVVLPRLPKEIVGMPDTDWILLMVSTSGNTSIRQMEEIASKEEAKLLKTFNSKISYTFTQITSPNSTNIMVRLKDKSEMNVMWKDIQAKFPNTPYLFFFVLPWNPSELPIPNPPDFQASIRGGTPQSRMDLARSLGQFFESKRIFKRLEQNPNPGSGADVTIRPHVEQWAPLMLSGVQLRPTDLVQISRLATEGVPIAQWGIDDRVYDVVMRFPEKTVSSIEDIAGFPLGINGKIVPLKALADVQMEPSEPPRLRRDMQDVVRILGRHDNGDQVDVAHSVKEATAALTLWQKENAKQMGTMSIQVDDAQHELNDALRQLGWAIGLSILLVFVTMVIQLGDLVSSLVVLVSIPLGFIGVIGALYIFGSTLSLNSALGVILLNGIAVANSIILVDFFNKLKKSGMDTKAAALTAARARLRPILMTSLTTTIGMLPIALGLGEGGRVLQPLGIAVSGGLWISMLFTLFIVPGLQVAYWTWRTPKPSSLNNSEPTGFSR